MAIQYSPDQPKRNANRPRVLSYALEPRILFDGAAVATADATTAVASDPTTFTADSALNHETTSILQALAEHSSNIDQLLSSSVTTSLEPAGIEPSDSLFEVASALEPASFTLNEAIHEAQQLITDFLQRPDAKQQLFDLFNGGQSEPDKQWLDAANSLIDDYQNQRDSPTVTLLSDKDIQGALGAFTAHGLDGSPTIYLNSDYLVTASSPAIRAVLLEELGHAIDARLNGDTDSPGDEGHAFASLVLHGDANFNAVSIENDHSTLDLAGRTIAVENADAFNIAQIHFVPLPEPDVQTALIAIAGAGKVSGNIQTVIAISATSNNTVVVYDHWEDGYEADINNPSQSTTQIWGDGNLLNGIAPGTANDLIIAGQTILLQNPVNPASPVTIDYDGRDKIGSTRAVAVTKAGWSSTPGTVLAGAVSLIDTGNAGKDFVIPFGQNVDTVATGTNRLFEYTSLHIIASADATTINIDKEGNGSFETTIMLNQGQTYLVNGGVLAGARITSDKGIGVYAIAGDVGSAYENRWFSVTPREQWANSYYAPVGTTLAADPAYVILYNPNATAIDVYYDTATTTGKITVPANVSGGTVGSNFFLMPASAAHFYTKDNAKFYAVSAIDADATSNATHDWSYSLVPETYLTTKFVVA